MADLTDKDLLEMTTPTWERAKAAIRTAHEKLIGEFQAFSQRMYQNAQESGSAGGNGAAADGATAPNDDEVAEAEIVDEQA